MMKFDKKILEFVYSLRNSRNNIDNAEHIYNKILSLKQDEQMQVLLLLLVAGVSGNEIFRSIKNKLGVE